MKRRAVWPASNYNKPRFVRYSAAAHSRRQRRFVDEWCAARRRGHAAASFLYCERMAAAPPPPSAGQKSLRAALQTRAFEPAYYFHGAEDYLKDEMVRLLIDAAVDPATRDFNLEVLR